MNTTRVLVARFTSSISFRNSAFNNSTVIFRIQCISTCNSHIIGKLASNKSAQRTL